MPESRRIPVEQAELGMGLSHGWVVSRVDHNLNGCDGVHALVYCNTNYGYYEVHVSTPSSPREIVVEDNTHYPLPRQSMIDECENRLNGYLREYYPQFLTPEDAAAWVIEQRERAAREVRLARRRELEAARRRKAKLYSSINKERIR